MRPFPRVEPVYLSTFVKNFLRISRVERSDFAIIEHTHNRMAEVDPAIRGVMLMINKIYALYSEIPNLSALQAEHLDSIAGLLQASLDSNSVSEWETRRAKAPKYRRAVDSVPPGCLSTQNGDDFIRDALCRMRALEGSSSDLQGEFAWLLPFRWAFSAPYTSRNLETGIAIFLLLRMHWGMPFHTYGWSREEIWATGNNYSHYWLKHGLWQNPDFPPPLSDRDEILIGTDL